MRRWGCTSVIFDRIRVNLESLAQCSVSVADSTPSSSRQSARLSLLNRFCFNHRRKARIFMVPKKRKKKTSREISYQVFFNIFSDLLSCLRATTSQILLSSILWHSHPVKRGLQNSHTNPIEKHEIFPDHQIFPKTHPKKPNSRFRFLAPSIHGP